MAANTDVVMSPAFNFDGWVELYNPTDEAVLLDGCYLSDDFEEPMKWQIPDSSLVVEPNGFFLLWFGSNTIRCTQAPFALDCEGGDLVLSSPSGEAVARLSYPAAISRMAYALTTDGGSTWGWTSTPTPAASNRDAAFATEQLAAPSINANGCLFEESLTFHVRPPRGATLRYTTDGTTPTLTNGETVTNTVFSIHETTTFRFRCFQEGMLPSPVVSRTYILKERAHELPIISVTAPWEYLYDDSIGVYVRGVNGRTGNGQSRPANYNMDWDRPVNFQYLLPETNTMVVNQDVNFCISGGWTRASNPKSFKLKADRVFDGQNTIDYAFFAAKPHLRTKTLQVRRGGNDSYCRIKDAALHEIIQRSGIDLDVMSYQPVVHYINGQYLGLINVREPNNKDFAFANWGFSKKQLEVYEQSPDSGAYMMIGSPATLLHLYDLSYDAAEPAVYDEICSLVDIDEYANYMAAELYLGSWDWPDNNLKAYRRADGGRFRITFFDLDAAFGTDGRAWDEEGEVQVGGNTFRWIDGMQWHRYDYIYDTGERRYGEIKFCTFFMNLLENADFRRKFADTFCMMGAVFEPTLSDSIMDELAARVRSTMSQEGASTYSSLEEIRTKLKGRCSSMTRQMKAYELMQLKDVRAQHVRLSSDSEWGDLYVNDTRVPHSYYSGQLFPPVTLRAEAVGGMAFEGWRHEGEETFFSTDAETALPEGSTLKIQACFRPLTAEERRLQGMADVVVNEVMAANDIFVDDYFKRNDWVELYNTTADTLDLEGWYLSNDPADPQRSLITAGTSTATTRIAPHGRLIVWCDRREPLRELHASFRLSADGGAVCLTSPDGSQRSTLWYPPHTGIESVARFPDGGSEVCVSNLPTIERPNLRTSYLMRADQQALGINDAVFEAADLHLRRVGHQLLATSATAATACLQLFSADGRLLHTAHLSFSGGRAVTDVPVLPAGLHIARLTDDRHRSVTLKMKNEK